MTEEPETPRRPRVVVEAAVHHVYNRLARSVEVFTANEEATRFVELLWMYLAYLGAGSVTVVVAPASTVTSRRPARVASARASTT